MTAAAHATVVSPGYVRDVSRDPVPWRWTSVLMAPVEFLGLVWGVGALILLVMAPIGLAVAAAIWLVTRLSGG